MKSRLYLAVLLIASASVTCFTAAAQQSATAPAAMAASNVVPSLINYAGVLKDASGRTLTSVTGVTFLLYGAEQGGAPLWLETQNVTPDKSGHYTVQLGMTSAKGLPSDVFVSGEARWLAVQIGNEAEQPRALLVAVPYAMKAADAQTLGGLPASAFVLATPPNSGAAPAATGSPALSSSSATPSSAPPPATSNVTTTGGTASTIPMFTTATNIQNSILTQISTTAINVGGRLNLPALGTATAAAGFNSRPLDFVASVFNGTTSTPVPQTFQWQAEPANNDKSTATGTLNLLYATGTAVPAETGLKINNKGQLTFAAGQTFPGTGPGTVKSVGLTAPATDFTVSGSPVTGTGTLNFAWNVVPTSSDVANAIVKRDATGSFSAGSGGFAGNLAAAGVVSGAAGSFSGGLIVGGAESVTGNLTVGGTISGNGSGLTNVNASNVASGTTLRGNYGVEVNAAAAGARGVSTFSFGFTLASAPTVNFIAAGGASTTNCPGSSSNPLALAGQLCVYESFNNGNVGFSCIVRTGPNYSCGLADPWGAGLFLSSTTTGQTTSVGSWAVTAP
jgi:hypothetical protein